MASDPKAAPANSHAQQRVLAEDHPPIPTRSSISEKRELEETPPPTSSPSEKAEVDIETSNPNTQEPTAKATRDVTGIRWLLVVLSILSSTFLWALDNTIVADVQPAIVRQFASVEKLPWLSVAFLLGASSTNLFWGQCYTQFNAKYVYMFCVCLFEIGSAVCGAAPTINALIVGRAICGFGGAGMYTGVMVLLSVTTLEQEKPIYFGLTGLTWGIGTILGPVIGGAFTDSRATWRWAFYINLVVGAVCAPIYIFLLPSAPPAAGQSSLKDRLRRIDFIGTVIFVGSFVCGILAISLGGVIYAWNSSRIIALFVTSGILIIIFFTQQLLLLGTTESTRLFPIHFLRSPLMVALFIATACAATTVFIPINFIPLYFQFVRNDAALKAGTRLLPYIAFTVAGAMANGIAMSKKPYYMPWYAFSGTLCILGSALLYAAVDESTRTATVWGFSIILGVGGGAFMQLGFTVMQTKIPEKSQIPVAVGFCTLAQLSGPVVALSVANAVFLNGATAGIRRLVPDLPAAALQAAISGAEGRKIEGVSPEMLPQVVRAVVLALRKVYILPLSAGALTLVMSLFMKREKLDLGNT